MPVTVGFLFDASAGGGEDGRGRGNGLEECGLDVVMHLPGDGEVEVAGHRKHAGRS